MDILYVIWHSCLLSYFISVTLFPYRDCMNQYMGNAYNTGWWLLFLSFIALKATQKTWKNFENIMRTEKPDTKGHRLKDSIDLKCPQ